MLKIILALIAAGTATAIPAQAPLTRVGNWVPHDVAPGVHALIAPDDYFGPAIGNVTVIEQSDGLVIIDSGLTAADGRRVVDYAKYLSPKPIKAVAITHWHNDHPQGVSAIRDAFPDVRIIATEATEAGMLGPEGFDTDYKPNAEADSAMAARLDEVLESLGKLYHDPATAPDRKARIVKALEQYRRFAKDFAGTYIVPPTETFRQSLLLDDPLRPVELRFLGRANTEGDLIAWLPREKVVASGDIVVSPTPFGFGSFAGNWINTIRKIEALGFSALIPGHGEVQKDQAYLEKLVATLTDIRAEVGRLAKAGVPVGKVKEKGDWTSVLARFSTNPRIKANFETLFLDPMIPNVYKEALGQPIVQGDGGPEPTFRPVPPKSTARRHDS